MKGYQSYKDSGVDWIGQIPSNWEASRIKFMSNGKAEYGLNIASDVYTGEGVRFLRTTDIDEKGYINTEGVYLSEDQIDSQLILEEGDFLISRSGTVGRAYVHCNSDETCTYAGYLVRFRFPDKVTSKFCFYVSKSWMFNMWLKTETIESTIGNVNGQKYANFRLPKPTKPDTEAIVKFLEYKTHLIDTLIEKKQKQIELLQEQKAAIINQAVTKGLNSNVKMKYSGIEWLGHVPEHWKISRLGHYAKVFNGATPSRNRTDYWQDGTIPWLSSGKVNDDLIIEPSEWITEGALRECSLQLVPRHSVVIGIVGQGRTRGTSALMGISAAINQNMAAIVPDDKLDSRYLHFLLQHMYDPIREYGRGSNQAALNCEQVAGIKILVPPINEQTQIIDKLNVILAKQKILLDSIEKKIIKLLEYRTTLISEVVTGKIDVRDEAIP